VARAAIQSAGQALVEFALVFPVVVYLLLGIVDLGRAVYAYNTIANAARTGARVAIVNQTITSPNDCPVTQSIQRCAADQAVSLGIDPASVQVSFVTADRSAICSPVTIGCLAQVTVPYTFTPITPGVASLIGPIHMSSTSLEPIESTYP
jgi:Flp pilus assembly protein TadG